MRWCSWTFFAALFCGCFTACADRPDTLTIALDYSPTNTVSNSWTLPPGQGKICILPVDDQRKDKSKIGENLEDPTKVVPIVSGLPSPTDWVHDTMAEILRNNGLTVVANAEDADVILNPALTVFWVNEDSEYHGRITLVIKVQDKNGKSVFSATSSGQYELSGHSLSPERYREVFSNSLYGAMNRLLTNAEFQQSLVVH